MTKEAVVLIPLPPLMRMPGIGHRLAKIIVAKLSALNTIYLSGSFLRRVSGEENCQFRSAAGADNRLLLPAACFLYLFAGQLSFIRIHCVFFSLLLFKSFLESNPHAEAHFHTNLLFRFGKELFREQIRQPDTVVQPHHQFGFQVRLLICSLYAFV